MTEKFAFEQFLRNRRTINFDQRRLCPGALSVDSARNQFLAHAGLAQYQNVGGRFGNGLYLRQHMIQCRAFTDNSAEVQCDVYFLSQVIAFKLKLLTQMRVFCQRVA